MVVMGEKFLFLPPQWSNTCDTQGGSLEMNAPGVVLDKFSLLGFKIKAKFWSIP